MNKTIINGIDVSECYADKKMMKDGLYCFWEGGNCADNEFCYFKELKRLQKENEELKKENSHKSCLIWYIFNCSKVETIQRLLYEYYECINDDRHNKKRVKNFWDDVFHLRPRRKYKSKYKQALEEIKEIAKLAKKDICNNCGWQDSDCCEPEGYSCNEFITILHMINEVLNDRD